MQDVREEPRRPKSTKYSLTWRSRDGSTCSADAQGLDISGSGAGVECVREIPVDAVVQLRANDGSIMGECFVAHCTRNGLRYHIGLEFSSKSKAHTQIPKPSQTDTDYYDVLQ